MQPLPIRSWEEDRWAPSLLDARPPGVPLGGEVGVPSSVKGSLAIRNQSVGHNYTHVQKGKLSSTKEGKVALPKSQDRHPRLP